MNNLTVSTEVTVEETLKKLETELNAFINGWAAIVANSRNSAIMHPELFGATIDDMTQRLEVFRSTIAGERQTENDADKFHKSLVRAELIEKAAEFYTDPTQSLGKR